MRRTVALNAWGYRGEVTWLSRGEHRFEVWWFRDRQAYLVADLIFKWNEE